ncbi:MAG: dTDP-4-dehydrorhamnose 3,5-epimerase [Bacteroidota bacterium]
MKVKGTAIEGLLIIEPRVFRDGRGYFFESFREEDFLHPGPDYRFVQDNQSSSAYGVIRGLHFQQGAAAQAKLVRVVSGTIYDVAVDLRPGSPTFGKWYGLELSDTNFLQLLIPRGFAHGFSVLSESAVVFYKCDAYYNKEAETGIRYNDPDLDINWMVPHGKCLVSEKDLQLPLLKELNIHG